MIGASKETIKFFYLVYFFKIYQTNLLALVKQISIVFPVFPKNLMLSSKPLCSRVSELLIGRDFFTAHK